jgi:cellobiose dehydrogenase (acceptor)
MEAVEAGTDSCPGLQTCTAQTVSSYTDKTTGIQFGTWGFLPNASDPDSIPASAAFTFGMALPGDALEKDANEYIGVLVGSPL